VSVTISVLIFSVCPVPTGDESPLPLVAMLGELSKGTETEELSRIARRECKEQMLSRAQASDRWLSCRSFCRRIHLGLAGE
jgi:hypothetical protein